MGFPRKAIIKFWIVIIVVFTYSLNGNGMESDDRSKGELRKSQSSKESSGSTKISTATIFSEKESHDQEKEKKSGGTPVSSHGQDKKKKSDKEGSDSGKDTKKGHLLPPGSEGGKSKKRKSESKLEKDTSSKSKRNQGAGAASPSARSPGHSRKNSGDAEVPLQSPEDIADELEKSSPFARRKENLTSTDTPIPIMVLRPDDSLVDGASSPDLSASRAPLPSLQASQRPQLERSVLLIEDRSRFEAFSFRRPIELWKLSDNFINGVRQIPKLKDINQLLNNEKASLQPWFDKFQEFMAEYADAFEERKLAEKQLNKLKRKIFSTQQAAPQNPVPSLKSRSWFSRKTPEEIDREELAKRQKAYDEANEAFQAILIQARKKHPALNDEQIHTLAFRGGEVELNRPYRAATNESEHKRVLTSPTCGFELSKEELKLTELPMIINYRERLQKEHDDLDKLRTSYEEMIVNAISSWMALGEWRKRNSDEGAITTLVRDLKDQHPYLSLRKFSVENVPTYRGCILAFLGLDELGNLLRKYIYQHTGNYKNFIITDSARLGSMYALLPIYFDDFDSPIPVTDEESESRASRPSFQEIYEGLDEQAASPSKGNEGFIRVLKRGYQAPKIDAPDESTVEPFIPISVIRDAHKNNKIADEYSWLMMQLGAMPDIEATVLADDMVKPNPLVQKLQLMPEKYARMVRDFRSYKPFVEDHRKGWITVLNDLPTPFEISALRRYSEKASTGVDKEDSSNAEEEQQTWIRLLKNPAKRREISFIQQPGEEGKHKREKLFKDGKGYVTGIFSLDEFENFMALLKEYQPHYTKCEELLKRNRALYHLLDKDTSSRLFSMMPGYAPTIPRGSEFVTFTKPSAPPPLVSSLQSACERLDMSHCQLGDAHLAQKWPAKFKFEAGWQAEKKHQLRYPFSGGLFSSVAVLILDENNLEDPTLGIQFANLTHFSARKNKLKKLDFLSNTWDRLTYLDVSGNQLPEFPLIPAGAAVPILETLIIQANLLQSADSLSNLKNLKVLDISGNTIKTLIQLVILSNLETLRANNCGLEGLWLNIIPRTLNKLRILEVQENPLFTFFQNPVSILAEEMSKDDFFGKVFPKLEVLMEQKVLSVVKDEEGRITSPISLSHLRTAPKA